MEPNCRELKLILDQFIRHIAHVLKTAKWGEEDITEEDLKKLAENTLAMHAIAAKFMEIDDEDHPLYYNAKIIKELTEEPLLSPAGNGNKTSLMEAATITKDQANYDLLRRLLRKWAELPTMSEVFFDDLKQISRELAA